MGYSPWSSSTGKVKAQSRAEGKKGACRNCGKSDHYSRDCPNDKQEQQLDRWQDVGRIRKAAGQAWMERRHEQLESAGESVRANGNRLVIQQGQ